MQAKGSSDGGAVNDETVTAGMQDMKFSKHERMFIYSVVSSLGDSYGYSVKVCQLDVPAVAYCQFMQGTSLVDDDSY